jgi:toxin ParE1/3/4
MPANLLVIAPAAKNDLKDIYQYGLRQWGQSRSDSYLGNIKDQLWSLTEQPLMGKNVQNSCPTPEAYPLRAIPFFTE